MLPTSSRYRTRAIRFMGVRAVDAWRVKEYAISAGNEEPSAALQQAARAMAAQVLLGAAAHTAHYGVAILGIHQGATDNLVFVSWWVNENELHHSVHRSPPDARERLTRVGSDGPVGCVWDLRILGFEAQAWVDEVLRRGRAADLERYLEKGWTCDA